VHGYKEFRAREVEHFSKVFPLAVPAGIVSEVEAGWLVAPVEDCDAGFKPALYTSGAL